MYKNLVNNIVAKKSGYTTIHNSDFNELNRWIKRGWGLRDPLRVIRYSHLEDKLKTKKPSTKPEHWTKWKVFLPLSERERIDIQGSLFRFRFNTKGYNTASKPVNNTYLAFKQKRYTVRKKFPVKVKLKKTLTNDYLDLTNHKYKQRLRTLVKTRKFEEIT